MRSWVVSSCLAAAILSVAAPALTAAPAPAKPDAQADKQEGSDWLRCDGAPRHESGGELFGRIIAITATAGVVGGLVGGPEMANVSKRAEGAAGASACEEALREEHDPFRQSQLDFALAIHEIEAKDYAAALKAAQSAPAVETAQQEYQRGLGISMLELQAAALVRLGRPEEAEAAALKMTEPLPWDLGSQLRAARYLDLTSNQSAAKSAYYDRLARIYPNSLGWKAGYQEWGGDFAGAAKTIAAGQAVYDGFRASPEAAPAIGFMGRGSVMLMLAGDMAASNKLADEARAAVDDMVKKGTALNYQATVNETDEMLEFQGIGRKLAEGHAAEARAEFAGKAHWLNMSAPEIAALAERLRKDATPAELTGQLAIEPAKIRSDGLTARLNALVDRPNAASELYSANRVLLKDEYFTQSARLVWRTDKSPYLQVRTAKDDGKFNGEYIYLASPAWGAPANEALMLHLALIAKARGKTGFVLSTARPKINSAFVLFGSSGDPGLPEPAFNNAEQVIGGIAMDIPNPDSRH